MFAVLTTGGKQYRVEAGTELLIERVPGDAGASITFDRVLLVGDGDSVTVGTPTVDGATVTGTVLGEALGPKLVIFKFKQKVKYRRHTGHRQHLTRVRIDEIAASGTSKRRATAAADEPAEPAETAAEKPAPRKRTRAAAADKAAPAEADAPPKPKRTRKPAAAKSADESEE
jgi:large subunit ribosomal protein L21